jgi:hypothetical protein
MEATNLLTYVILLYYVNILHETAIISYKHKDGIVTDIEERVAVNKPYD